MFVCTSQKSTPHREKWRNYLTFATDTVNVPTCWGKTKLLTCEWTNCAVNFGPDWSVWADNQFIHEHPLKLHLWSGHQHMKCSLHCSCPSFKAHPNTKLQPIQGHWCSTGTFQVNSTSRISFLWMVVNDYLDHNRALWDECTQPDCHPIHPGLCYCWR